MAFYALLRCSARRRAALEAEVVLVRFGLRGLVLPVRVCVAGAVLQVLMQMRGKSVQALCVAVRKMCVVPKRAAYFRSGGALWRQKCMLGRRSRFARRSSSSGGGMPAVPKRCWENGCCAAACYKCLRQRTCLWCGARRGMLHVCCWQKQRRSGWYTA
jgi:hypothetical protein